MDWSQPQSARHLWIRRGSRSCGRVTINPNEVETTFSFAAPKCRTARAEDSHSGQCDGWRGRCPVRRRHEQIGRTGRSQSRRRANATKSPPEVLQKIVEADKSEITALLQKFIRNRSRKDLIAARIRQIKDGGALAAHQLDSAARGSVWRNRTGSERRRLCRAKSTVSTVCHLSSEYKSLELEKFCREMRIPVIVGNTVGCEVTFEIMECGPGRGVDRRRPRSRLHIRAASSGLGVPQVTATVDCAAARDAYFKKLRATFPDHHRRRNE